MNKLQLTIEALQTALADAPETPTAWVPLRRIAVEEALRMLGGLETTMATLRTIEDGIGNVPGPAPTWRYPVMSAEEAAGQGENVAQFAYEVTTARTNGNSNGAVTVAPAERLTYTQPARSARKTTPAPDKATNGWRRKPKEERLALVCAEIARIAGDRPWLTQSEFNQGKPESMPKASAMAMTLGLTWVELVCKALPHAVVPAAQPASRKGTAAPAAETFRDTTAEA